MSSNAEARLTILSWPSRLNCFIYLPFKCGYDQCQPRVPAAEVSRMSDTVFLPVRGCWKLTQKCDLHVVLPLWWFGQKYHQARLWIRVLFRLHFAASFAPAAEKTRQRDFFFFLSPRVQVLVQSWSVEARSYGLQQVAIMSTFMASNMHLLARVLPARYATLCVWQWICCGEARLLPAVRQRYQHVDTVVQNSCCYDLNQS